MQNAWWKPLYDDALAELLLERSSARELEETVGFLCDELGLAPGARVLDQCCGIGSLSLPLAARGIAVTGIDQSESYIARATRDAERAGVRAVFAAADAFEYVASPRVDAAFNWWTSFGYTLDDAHNARMLASAFASLRPGGKFVLDFMNVPGVLRGFQRSVATRKVTSEGEIVLLRETELDLEAGAMLKLWTYFLPNGQRVERRSSVRLYLPHTLAELLRKVGFEEVGFFGGTTKQPLELDSPRCIVVARRPS